MQMAAILAFCAAAASALADPPVVTNPPASQTIFLGDAVTFRVGAGGTPPLSFQWLRNGAVISGATSSALTFVTAAADNNALFAARVTNVAGAVTSAPAALLIDFGSPGLLQTNRLLEITNVWRYNVSKTDLGMDWTAPAYNDAAWPAGSGLLYVEDGNLPAPKTTALPLTPGSLPTTCYFRTRFTNAFANAWSLGLVANTVIDDGVVLHLNGAEALRLGMSTGTVTYATLASRTVGDAGFEGPFDLPTTNLLASANVLAAEVHQVTTNSTDIVMGLTLDAVWQPRLRDTHAPVVTNLVPAAGETLAALTQIQAQFSEAVYGVDAADLLINSAPATNLAVLAPNDYVFRFPSPAAGPVSVTWAAGHGITDRSANSNAFAGGDFGYTLDPATPAARLAFASVAQSSDASATNGAGLAVDGAAGTFSLTANLPGSWWQAQFGRPFPLRRIEIVNRAAPFAAELGGLVLRLFNLDDQVVFSTNLTNPGPGAAVVLPLPQDTAARMLWIGLPGSQTNGAGNYRVGLAEVRAYGAPDLPFGPPPAPPGTNLVRVWQSSEYGGFPAENAVDGNPASFTHTADVPNSFWMADLGRAVRMDRVEIVNRASCCDNRLANLVLRIFDGASNSVAAATLTNPGLGATWTNLPPTGTTGRWMRVGLENNQVNGGGNYYVTLAEARVFSGGTNVLIPGSTPVPVTSNLASFKLSYMTRLDDTVPPASNANDDNYSTETKTTLRTVDGCWEVDLGVTRAVYGLRAIAASGIGHRLTNCTVRLYDETHESVHAQRVTGSPDAFDVDLNGPRFARYVRVGLEDKQRTDPAGGIEFYIGFREVEVFGRPTNQVGILAFSASTNQVQAGQTVTLHWAVDDVRRVELHPGVGSVGACTAANGVGSLTLPVTNSTEFVLVATNPAGGFARAIAVQLADNSPSAHLSECVADNRYSLKDGYGDAPDWIELRNPANTPVDLTGWGLSDNPAQPMKWTFPGTTLAAHSALVVFASGRAASVDPAGHLHASFRLEKHGGAVLLTAADGVTAVDSVTYPELDTDLAYGRDLAGHWTFLEPTPGAVNVAPTYPGWLKELDWSHARGFYESGFALTLTNKNPGATVLYSLDGSEPSLTYSNALAVTGTSAIRARAFRAGYKPARVQTRTFLFVNDVITSPVMNPAITQDPNYASRIRPGLLALPSLSIAVPGQPEYEEKEGSVEVLWPGGGDPVQINCGVSRFGNAWTKFAKRSFRLKARARYGEAKLSVPLFNGFDRGALAKTSFDALDLRSGSQDMVDRGFYMAGRFVEDSTLDMGSLNPHGRFVHVYVNGVYWGQYDCRELLVDHFLADYLGGSEEDYVTVRGNDNVSDDFVLGTPDPPNLNPWEYLRTVKNSYTAARPYLDMSHLTDFMLLWFYGNCESEFRACGPVAPGSGFKFWIADADGFLRTSALGLNRLARVGPGGLWGGLVSEGHPDFKMLVADRIYRHFYNAGALTPAANDARLAARMEEVRDSLLAECARWGYRTPANWESSAATIRTSLFPARTSQLVGYLRSAGLYPAFDPPVFSPYGGLVTNGFQPVLTSASGTIYYTLDGSDPRLPGGGLAAGARVWTPGAVTITNDLTLNVRVRTAAGAWSALAQPRYLLATRRAPGARDLLVTEICYNPAGSDDCEFIELWNASTNLLDLSGVSLSNAVRFVFPSGFALAPGAFVLVVENTPAFAARFQSPGSPYLVTNLTVAGAWVGALDNAGETLALVASNGVELSSISYRTSGDWPARADGRGSSLELLPPAATATDAEVRAHLAAGRNWRASSLYHGSPGRLDDFVSPVRINEVLSNPSAGEDWLELFNTSAAAVYLSDCSLTDDFDRPARCMFPTNTVLAPGQFRVFISSQLGFGLDKLGDDAALLQLSGTNVLRILDSVELPAVAAQEPLGVFLRSDGRADFTELRALTPGAANALPRVGPVVLSEVLFAPAPGKAEFVELANLTGSPVPLFDPARPTNTWRLDGVGAFVFPTGTVIEACSTLVVCSTNPAAFRAQYGLAPTVPVLGPWSGALDDDGETLQLLRPGTSEPNGTVPWLRVDQVSYRTNAPWPATLAGRSFERAPVEGFGNDPATWRAGPLHGTPGAIAANRPPVITVIGAPVIPQFYPLALTVAAADVDAPWQTTTLVATHLPPGGVFDPAVGRFAWTPSAAQAPGEFTARFVAADNAVCGGAQTELLLPVRVTAPLALAAQVLTAEVRLTFPVLGGETYRVEYCTDLTLADWRLLEEVAPLVAQSVTVADVPAPQSAARFYRVRWLR